MTLAQARARIAALKSKDAPFDADEFASVSLSQRFAAKHPDSAVAQEIAVSAAYRAGKEAAEGSKRRATFNRAMGLGARAGGVLRR